MWPARTASPPKRLTPRRCAFDSRLFLDEDWPFLWAMTLLLTLDAGHADARERVAVAATPAIVVTTLVLEDPELLATKVIHHLRGRDRARHERAAHRDLVT